MKEKILELRKQGLSINQIVEILKCAKSTVSYHINKNQLGGRVDGLLYNVDEDKIKEIIKLREGGSTYDEIYRVVSISKDKLKKICRDNELNKPISTQIKNLDTVEVTEYYKSVKSLRLTAKHFDVSRDTIRKYISDSEIIEKGGRKTKSKSKAVIDWRKRKKVELVEYKGGKCEICGYNKSYNVLQFHHINPDEKDFTISRKSYSLERLKKEVDKCILVCANCHIEIHEK